MDTDSEVIIPPASIQQLDGETESGGEETNSGDKESHDKKSDREKPDVDYYIKCTGCSFKNIFFTKKGICVPTAVISGFQEKKEKCSTFARVDTTILALPVKAVE